MKTQLKRVAKRILGRSETFTSPEFEEAAGGADSMAVELIGESQRLLKLVLAQRFSMSPENNLLATALACQHVVERNIPGDFVECGVWRGGHAIIAAGVFESTKQPRETYMLDTFSGMSEPTENDARTYDGASAVKMFEDLKRRENSGWCAASLDEVKDNFKKAGVSLVSAHFIQGKVEDTLCDRNHISRFADRKIAVLRLDTDWFESTKIELERLWPLVSPGGIMIVDDYGYWSGAKKAVDDYFSGNPPFLSPVDRFARLVVKPL
jgi:hypothetical protein